MTVGKNSKHANPSKKTADRHVNTHHSISTRLKRIRTAAFKTDAVAIFWMIYSVGLFVFLTSLISESVFYFSAAIRTWFIVGSFTVFIIFLLIALVGFFLALANKIERYRWSSLARKVGKLAFQKEDTVINALQLERSLSQSNSVDLSQSFIRQIHHRLSALDLKTLLPDTASRRWKHSTLLLLIFSLVTMLATWDYSTSAMYRWAHPDRDFPVPTPYSLKSVVGDLHLLGGESTTITIEAVDASPDSVFLRLTATNPIDGDTTLPANILLQSPVDSSGGYSFTIEEIYQDYAYEAFVPATYFWEAWVEIVSPDYRILVTDRPTMEEFMITVIPPAYSKLKAESQGENQADVQGLKGSTLSVRLLSNRKLAKCYLNLNEENIPLSIRGKRAEGEFTLASDGMFTVHLLDKRGISNRDPIPYHLQLIPDLAPLLHVLLPAPETELGDDLLIPIHLEIEDDFGFSNLQVGYEIRRPSYIQAEPFISIFTIRDLIPDKLHQDIKTLWDVSDLGLMPDDEVHFHFELYDNDNVSGPKKSISGTFIARLPSLADLFESMENEEQTIMEESRVNLEDIQSIQEHLEEVELDLLKSDKVEWEHQQEIKKLLEKTKEELAEFEKIAEALEALSENAEKHDLFSPELLEKFKELQELVSEIISEDLLMNIDAVQDALNNMDMKDLMSSLEQMAENMGQLEQELDRFLDIFKRIQAEQRVDEINKRLEQLVKEQDVLDEKIGQTNEDTDPSTFARLEQEEKRNLDEFKNIQAVMKEAADLMEEFSKSSAAEMEELAASDLAEETKENLSEAMDQLGEQSPSDSRHASRSALQNLQSMQQMAQSIANNFQQETASEMAAKFQTIMRDVLQLSKMQESLRNATSTLPRNSPQIRDMAQRQQQLKDQLAQIMKKLMELSKETFAVTPAMGRAIGAASAHMNESTSHLSERHKSQSSASQGKAMKGLNETAQSIFSAIQQMQSGGSASGFEQFLEAMQKMSGQQQGMNDMGMQMALGQMGAAMQQAMMQKMLGGQQQVRKSLQQLMNEMQQSGGNQGLGDLSGMAKDMDEVIRDLQKNKFTRRTQERQQRILSRMLDSQKSMSQRGKKEERKSTTATTHALSSGPSGLPADLGQRRSLTMEALNRAMKAGYSRDYQSMIRRYFNALGREDIPGLDVPVETSDGESNE